jgi:protein ImuA
MDMPSDYLSTLRERVRRIERPTSTAFGVLPFGIAEIDRALPCGGLARGALHEVLGSGGDEEDGALAAAFIAEIVGRLMSVGEGIVLWCQARADLYGPGLAAHGLDPALLLLVRASRDAEILWAMEEGLRASGVAAVVGEIGVLPGVASRRLQLAAERSGVTAFVLRRWRNVGQAARERNLPNAAATRWHIAALPSRSMPVPYFPDFSAPIIRASRVSGDPRIASASSGALRYRFPHDTGLRAVGARGGDRSTGPGIGYPRWRVELLRCRGGEPASWEVEVHDGRMTDATDSVSVAQALGDQPAAPVGSDASAAKKFRRTG